MAGDVLKYVDGRKVGGVVEDVKGLILGAPEYLSPGVLRHPGADSSATKHKRNYTASRSNRPNRRQY
eukprot:3125773-Rhodomonas_salina.2